MQMIAQYHIGGCTISYWWMHAATQIIYLGSELIASMKIHSTTRYKAHHSKGSRIRESRSYPLKCMYTCVECSENEKQRNGNLKVTRMKEVLYENTDVNSWILTRLTYSTGFWTSQLNPTSFNLSLSKRAPWSGFVKMSATISPVGSCTIATSFVST